MELIEGLLQHDYKHHVRGLETLLLTSMGTSPRGVLELTDAVRAELRLPGSRQRMSVLDLNDDPSGVAALGAVEDPHDAADTPADQTPDQGAGVQQETARDGSPLPTRDRVLAALDRHRWVKTKVADELGLRNRFQLLRLMKKYDIE